VRERQYDHVLLALALIAVWTACVPLISAALGVDIGVDTRTEVVDHVIPGAACLAAVGVLRGRVPGSMPAVAAAGVAMLAGLWVFVSHLPLLAEVGQPPVTWPEALLHAASGAPMLVLGGFVFAREVRAL
jgi:hypothetical protein